MSEQIQKQEGQTQPTLKDLFKIRDFRYLWTGQVVSDFGDSMTSLALMLLVLELTDSISALATMAIILAIPSLTFGLVAGVYIDRFDRRKIMIYSDLLRGIFVLGFLFVDSPDKVWILYVIGFIQAAIGTFFTPARSALLPNLIDEDLLLSANSISQTSNIIFRMLGTGAAGALVSLLGNFSYIFMIDSATFILSLLLLTRIAYRGVPKQSDDDITPSLIFRQIKEGLSITFSNRILSGAILGFSLTMLGIGAINILLVPLIVNDLQISETWFAGIELAQTSAMIISGSIFAVLASRFKPTNILSISLTLFGFSIALLALPTNIWQLLPLFFLFGLMITPIQAAGQTIIQTAVPDEVRGRTGSANNALVTTASLISMAAAGLLADAIGVRNVFILSGAIVALAGVASGIVFRGQIPQPDTPQPAEV